MSLQVEKLEKNMAKLTIEVSAEELEKAIEDAYQKNKNKISIPGFRKGKAPRKMIENMYGREVFYEDAANALIPDAYEKALEECEEEIVSSPKVDVVQLESGKPFIFTAEVALKPEVTLGKYKGVKVEKADTAVTEEEVEAEIKKEQEKNSRTVDVTDRAVQKDDVATIDFEGFVDGVAFEGGKGADYPLTIGSGTFIPGFEEQIIGHMPGEEFDIEVMFPEQYHSADLAGKPAVFRIYLHKTEEKIVPELNDAFAAVVSEYNTLAEYKEYLRELEVQRREQAAKNAAMEQALQKAIANAQMEEYAATEEYEALVRDAEDQLIGRFEQDLQAQGITMDQYLSMTQETMEGLHRQVHPSAEQKVQAELVLEAVAETEGLDVTEEEVEIAVAQLAAQYQVNLAAMKNALDMDALRQNLRINKAASLIADSAVEIF